SSIWPTPSINLFSSASFPEKMRPSAMELRSPSAGRLRSFATTPRNLSYVFMTKFCTNSRSSGVMGRAPLRRSLNFPLLKTTEASPTLLKSCSQIVNHVVAGGPVNRSADQTAHHDDHNAIGNAAAATLYYYFAEFCRRLFADYARADATEESNGQENINDHARAKRQEQKERETAEFAICHDPPENWRKSGLGTSAFRLRHQNRPVQRP